MKPQGLISVKEASSYLGISPSTVYRLVESDDIPYIKRPGLGVKFSPKSVDDWLEKSAKKAPKNALNSIINQQYSLTLPPFGRILKSDGKPKGGTGEMAKHAKSATRLNLGYGAIYQRKTKQGRVRWYLDYHDQGGKRIQRVAQNAQSAEDATIELRLEIGRVFRAEHGLESEKKVATFSELAAMYLKDYARVNKRSWKTDEFRLRALGAFLNGYVLNEITPQVIERFRSERLRSEESRSTINRRMALLKKMFNLAKDWGYAKENPVCKVRFFSEKENERVRVLSEDEERRLLEVCYGNLRQIILLALHTGMRRGEILNMKWADIDLSKNEIRIPHSKSGRPRFIPINQTLRAILEGLRANAGKNTLVFPFKSVRTAFEKACSRAEIDGLSFHDLRRTFGTRLLEKGVNIVTISRYYGHSSLLVTQRYLHPRDELNREAIERLNPKAPLEPLNRQDPLHPCDTAEGQAALGPLTSTNVVN